MQRTKQQRIIDQYGLIEYESKGSSVKEISIAERALDLAFPAAYADELGSVDKSIFTEDLNINFGEKLLIGSGRALVKTGQGIKQLGLAIGEKVKVVHSSN